MGNKLSDFNPKVQRAIRDQLASSPTSNTQEVAPGVEIRTNLTIRPSTDIDGMNKTERAFYNYILMLNYLWVGYQSITLKLADDTRYTGDFPVIGFNGELIIFETKGFFREDAKVKLKVAARQFTWIHFKLVKKISNGWDITDVKP